MNSNESMAIQHQDGVSSLFRLGGIYWLAICNDGMRLPDELHDDFDSDCWSQAFGDEMPDWIDGGEELAQALIDGCRFGFLARADIQRPVAVHAHGYSTNGWGVYWTQWVYAESVDELYAKAAEVAKGKIDAQFEKLRKEAA